MRIKTGYGGSEIYIYEPGDLVRLSRDEGGSIVTAFAGDWGRVLHVHPDGSLDITFAGYSRSRTAHMVRAVAVRSGSVQPCDGLGRPRPRGQSVVWTTREAR